MDESEFDDRPGGIHFEAGAVRPMECINLGWSLIKGDYWTFLGISVVGILIGSVAPFGILLGPMMCGIYLCLMVRERGGRFSFEMLFKGFDYFVQSLIATLVMVVPIMTVAVIAYIGFLIFFFTQMPAGGGPPNPGIGLNMVIGILVFMLAMIAFSLAMQVLFFFIYPLIVEHGLTGMNAIRLSIRAAMANLGGLVGLVLLNMLLGCLGVLACYVGAFFVMPLHLAANFAAYRLVFPRESSSAAYVVVND